MWQTDPQPEWLAVAEEALAGMKGWRMQHPTATWQEIEAALDERLAKLRARMLQDSALASAAADLRGTTDRPRCPDCDQPLQAVGQEARHLTTQHEQPITLTRTYARCPACGAGLFPPR